MSIFILVAVAAIVLIWLIIIRRRSGIEQNLNTKSVQEKWAEIEGLLSHNSDAACKLAVIEADKLMDSALKGAKARGGTMGERLRYMASLHPQMRPVWEAHNLRNELAHNSHYILRKNDAERALKIFKEGLKIMNAI